MIFLSNTVLDVGLPSAQFARDWIAQVGSPAAGMMGIVARGAWCVGTETRFSDLRLLVPHTRLGGRSPRRLCELRKSIGPDGAAHWGFWARDGAGFKGSIWPGGREA